MPGTPVLLADGTYKPIEQIKLGDRVLATDPTGSLTQGRPVTALIPGDGLKKLVRITVDTDGDRGNATGIVTATDEHPFWEARTGSWTDAEDLDRSDLLRTPDGRLLEVVDVHEWTQQQQVHNLTVEGLHTYYVRVGDSPVLVHNENRGGLQDSIRLYGDYTARMDKFNVQGQASFEIHVYHRGVEVGVYGSNGFFNKHGLKASGVEVPNQVLNRLKGIAVDQMRKLGQISAGENIKGDAWKRPMIGSSGDC